MSADLRSNTSFARISVVVLDDCVVKLEHGRTEDRVRKYMYDAIESVVIWRKIPGARVAACVIFLALPGLALLVFGSLPAKIIGGFVAALGIGLTLWYLYCQNTTIRIVRAGKPQDLIGIFRPGKVRRFRDKLLPRIYAAQAALVDQPPIPPAQIPPPEPASLPSL